MQKYKVIFMPSATEDILSIYAFIARDSIFYAEAVTRSIYDWSVKMFAVVPHIGQIIYTAKMIREVTEPQYGYKIRFQISGDDVHVLMIYKWQNRPL
jgi:hypothetical protein